MPQPYDALLIVSFGGPEQPVDVIPFLENVLRGRNVPRERLEEVAEHYYHFGGRSPINDQNRVLIAALRDLLDREGPPLPIYWGNRNWHPFLAGAMREMRDAGVARALAFFTSAYSSYSGCRQYRENVAAAQAEVPGAPQVDKLRAFFNHPRFLGAVVSRLRDAWQQLPGAHIAFTAHSIPRSMADTSRYEEQLLEACRLAAAELGTQDWRLVYQSRSGPPSQPWLGPDINDYLRESRPPRVIISPIGFVSDHLEILYDLDTDARATCDALGIEMVRASTPGTHPDFVAMIRDLIVERMNGGVRPALGVLGPSHDVCPIDCCPPPRRG